MLIGTASVGVVDDVEPGYQAQRVLAEQVETFDDADQVEPAPSLSRT